MKKFLAGTGLVCTLFLLAACGNSNSVQSKASDSTSSSVVKKYVSKYSDKEYALMAYMKATNQEMADVQENAANISWSGSDDHFEAVNNDQTVTMTVEKDAVVVNEDNQETTFSKHSLAKHFTNKHQLDTILGDLGKQNDANSASSTTADQQASTNQQGQAAQAGQQTGSNGHVTIAGHSFHHEDFYGNDILVGDNSEGEAEEFLANDPSLNKDQRYAALSQASSQEHPNLSGN